MNAILEDAKLSTGEHALHAASCPVVSTRELAVDAFKDVLKIIELVDSKAIEGRRFAKDAAGNIDLGEFEVRHEQSVTRKDKAYDPENKNPYVEDKLFIRKAGDREEGFSLVLFHNPDLSDPTITVYKWKGGGNTRVDEGQVSTQVLGMLRNLATRLEGASLPDYHSTEAAIARAINKFGL